MYFDSVISMFQLCSNGESTRWLNLPTYSANSKNETSVSRTTNTTTFLDLKVLPLYIIRTAMCIICGQICFTARAISWLLRNLSKFSVMYWRRMWNLNRSITIPFGVFSRNWPMNRCWRLSVNAKFTPRFAPNMVVLCTLQAMSTRKNWL